jgi:glycosyltransferase involved in cell wall biosynthesis
LLQNQELRKQTGQKGQQVALEKFSWDKISEQLERYCKAQL